MIADLIRAGVDPELVARVADEIASARAEASVQQRSAGAIRQARHRSKIRNEVTESDITSLRNSNVTSPPNDIISNPPDPSLRSETVQARKAKFAEFRQAYPKRVGSNPWQPAEDKFCRLIRDGVDPGEILDGTRRYAASRAGEDPKFTCTALVFLNQGRWKDDHVVAPTSGHHARAGPAKPPEEIRDPMVAAADRYLQRLHG